MSKYKVSVYFSGKITHSFICYLNSKGADLEAVFESADTPSEFLRDPSCWIEAPKVEKFLESLEKEFCHYTQGENFLEVVGHACKELNSWGALDSVLKLMQKPQDIFNQPQSLISYFVSPPPPIANLMREEEGISFELPISKSEYPYVTEFLRAAFEALPSFMGIELATATWKQTKLSISWSRSQESIFNESIDERNIKPDFMNSLMHSLERAEKEIEAKNKEISEQSQVLAQLQIENENLRATQINNSKPQQAEWAIKASAKIDKPIAELQTMVMRLNDYMARSQQLVTLLVGQDRLNPQVKEAMRRMDWDYILSEYPHVVSQSIDNLKQVREVVSEFKDVGTSSDEKVLTSQNLSGLVEKAIATLKKPKEIEVDKMFFFDRKIDVHAPSLTAALKSLLNDSIQTFEKQGSLRVVTRPRGAHAEIEISDTGTGLDKVKYKKSKTWQEVSQVVREHKGKLSLNSSSSGSTFTLSLPLQ